MAGAGLDDAAYRARAALLRDPARPSTTPFLDAHQGMMNPLDPFGLEPMGSYGGASPAQMQRYPRPFMADRNRPPGGVPYAGAEETLFDGGMLKSMAPWAQTLSDAASGVAGAVRDFTTYHTPSPGADDEIYAGLDASPGPEAPRDTGGWATLRQRFVEGFTTPPDSPDLQSWDADGGTPTFATEVGAAPEADAAPSGVWTSPDAAEPSPTAARDAAVPRDMVIGRTPGSAAATSETAASSSPSSSSAPAMPTPPSAQPYDGSVGDAAKMEAQDSALLRAGLAMMASDNPSFAGVLGEGGLAGLDGYEADMDAAREDARYGAEYDMKAQQQAFENEIAQVSTQLAFAKDAREEKLLTARLARAMSAGSGGRMPKNRYEFYLMGVEADLEALARNAPDGRLPPEVIASVDDKWRKLTQQIHSRDDGMALDEDTGNRPPIGSSAASLLGDGP